MSGAVPDRVIRINLSAKTIREETVEPAIRRAVLGGRGLAAHELARGAVWRRDPLSPESEVVLAPGMLGATPWPSASRVHLGFRSPLTGIYGYANAGGAIGARLAALGVAAVVISGRSERPVVLRLGEEGVRLEPADALWGLTTSQTEEVLRERSPRAAIASIGPAGEAGVRFAAVINDGGRAAARCGGGAVLGSKRLKAVVVDPAPRPQFPDSFAALARAATRTILADAGVSELRRHGTPLLVSLKNERGDLPAWNHRRGQVPFIGRIDLEAFAAQRIERKACAGCPIRCGWITEIASGPHRCRTAGPEYESIDALSANCGCSNPEAVIYANALCNDLGLDTISAGAAVAFAMECGEHGLLPRGIPAPAWGDGDAIVELIEQIAARRGLGEILADGVRAASEALGEATRPYAMHVKGLEIPGQDPRASKGFGLGHATSNRGADHLYALPTIAVAGLEQAAADLFPELLPQILDPLDEGTKPQLVVYGENYCAVSDALGVCKFTTTETYALRPERIARALSSLGFAVDAEQLLEAGERIVNLERLINGRMGITGADDLLPERFVKEPLLLEHDRAVRIESIESMVARYYELRGWGANGLPTDPTQRRLGLSGWGEDR